MICRLDAVPDRAREGAGALPSTPSRMGDQGGAGRSSKRLGGCAQEMLTCALKEKVVCY